jgi:RNA polymerase sigma factor (sigma-70 family)
MSSQVTETFLAFEKLHLSEIRSNRSYEDADDDQLLKGCVFDHREARTEFFTRYEVYIRGVVRRTVSKYCKSVDLCVVEDLVQEVFVALLAGNCRRLRMFKGKNGCPLRAWVRVIAMRTTVSQMRRWKHHSALPGDDNSSGSIKVVDDSTRPDRVYESQLAKQRSSFIFELVESLSPEDKVLFNLIYIDEVPVPELTERLNIQRGALYMRKNRVIARLRRQADRKGLAHTL